MAAKYSAYKDMNNLITSYMDATDKVQDAMPEAVRTVPTGAANAEKKLTAGEKKITLIGGGRAQNPVASEKALKSGQCDLIFIGHGLLAQPDLVNLIDEDREDEIRPCIGCGHCAQVCPFDCIVIEKEGE